MTTTFPPDIVAAVYALGDDIDAFKVKQDTLEQSARAARLTGSAHASTPSRTRSSRWRRPDERDDHPVRRHRTETEDYISFRLPSWLTEDERARIRAAMDEWWVNSSGARQEGRRHQ